MQKKGEKSLQMIFGLFILLIISLVVLSMFFKFIQKSEKTLSGEQKTFFEEQEKQQCQIKCETIQSVNDAIEFCKATLKIDANKDQVTLGQKASYGRWDYCEDKVPCFIVVESCKEIYTPTYCRNLLQTQRLDAYTALFGDEVTGGSCGLNATSPGNWYVASMSS